MFILKERRNYGMGIHLPCIYSLFIFPNDNLKKKTKQTLFIVFSHQHFGPKLFLDSATKSYWQSSMSQWK